MIEFKNAKISALRKLWQEAFFDTDEFLDSFFSTAYSRDRSIAAFIDNELAGALYFFECELNHRKIAYIYAVATVKKHRGKGVCSQLMAYTHKYLKNEGFAASILVPGNKELFSFYEKLGYKTCGYINEFEVSAIGEKVKTDKISMSEYLLEREKYLPENSVNLTTEFLNKQFEFFKGENLIFAARQEKDRLFCGEILGNIEKAPTILSAFGFKKGVFRTCGSEKPFVMGYSLTENPLQNDIYFPFAFD